MYRASKRIVIAATAAALAGTMATTPAFAETPVTPIVTKQVLFSEIAAAETAATYDQWHQGYATGLTGVSVSAAGLRLEGKQQIIKGNTAGIAGKSVSDVASSLVVTDTVTAGSLWLQVPLRYGPQPAEFTTLRKDASVTGSNWTTSRAIRKADNTELLAANSEHPLADIQAALTTAAGSFAGYTAGPVSIGYGFLSSGTEADVTVKDFTALDTKYDFTQKVVADAAVTVAGSPVVGSTLTANATEVAGVTVAYKWFAGADAIAGATAKTLPVTADLLGKAIKVEVTFTSPDYVTTVKTSEATAAVLAPIPGTGVSVFGNNAVGGTLTADAIAVDGATVAYQWFAGTDTIAGATAAALPVTAGLVGKDLTVVATYSKAGLADTKATSRAVKAVVSALPKPAVLTSGTAAIGSTVNVHAAWSVKPDAVTYQWKLAGKDVAGATADSFKVTTDALGKEISVVVTGKKGGYADATETVVVSGVAPQLVAKVSAKATKKKIVKGKSARIRVNVAVANAPAVAGTVTVKVGKVSVTKKVTKAGTVTVKVSTKKLKASKKARAISVSFAPDAVTGVYTKGAKATAKVVVTKAKAAAIAAR